MTSRKYYGNVTSLVLVGVLVDKGPDSLCGIRFARPIGAIWVLGNHDDSGIKKCIKAERR